MEEGVLGDVDLFQADPGLFQANLALGQLAGNIVNMVNLTQVGAAVLDAADDGNGLDAGVV